MRRLARELRELRGATELPLGAAAAIFLRHDSDRPDLMRALITGGSPHLTSLSGLPFGLATRPPGY